MILIKIILILYYLLFKVVDHYPEPEKSVIDLGCGNGEVLLGLVSITENNCSKINNKNNGWATSHTTFHTTSHTPTNSFLKQML